MSPLIITFPGGPRSVAHIFTNLAFWHLLPWGDMFVVPKWQPGMAPRKEFRTWPPRNDQLASFCWGPNSKNPAKKYRYTGYIIPLPLRSGFESDPIRVVGGCLLLAGSTTVTSYGWLLLDAHEPSKISDHQRVGIDRIVYVIVTYNLVGCFNMTEKYESTWVHLPQFSGWKLKKCHLSCHHLVTLEVKLSRPP